jgi:hypothetical protein
MSKDSNTGSGVSLIGLTGLAFVILKLTGVINWSWWWVTLPFWGGWGLILLVVIIFLIYEAIK